MTRHYAEPNINILLTRNLLTVKLSFNDAIACFWATSNNRTRGQFECDVTCLFMFSSCVNKTSWLKLWIIINKRHFMIFLNNWTHKRMNKINEFILKTKTDLKEGLDNRNRHPLIMFSFNWLIIIWRAEVRLKLDVQGQGGGRILDVDGQGRWGVLKLDNFHGRHMFIILYWATFLIRKMYAQNKRRAIFNLLIINQYHTKCFYCKFYKNLCEGYFITNYHISTIIKHILL